MRVIGFLLRLWSYVSHLVLSLFLLLLALISATSHQRLKLGMLPFSDDRMLIGLVTLGVAGLICTLLAMTGRFRYLFPLWAAVVLVLMVKGFILSPYTFPNADAFRVALWLIFGALCAFLGALWVLKPRRGRL